MTHYQRPPQPPKPPPTIPYHHSLPHSLPVPPLEVQILNLAPPHCEYRSPYATTVREPPWPRQHPDRHHPASPPLVELRWQWWAFFTTWEGGRYLKVLGVLKLWRDLPLDSWEIFWCWCDVQQVSWWLESGSETCQLQLLRSQIYFDHGYSKILHPNSTHLSPIARRKCLECPKFEHKP